MNKGTMRRGLPPAAAGIPAPADKRFRRSDARPTRKRSWRTAARRIALLATTALLAAASLLWGANTLMSAGRFRISNIAVHGTTYLPADEVRALVGDLQGQSIFEVKLDEYQRRVEDHRWVGAATLRRVFPSTVDIAITERTPLVLGRLNGLLYLVDATGTIVDAAGPQYKAFDLPIVDGLLSDESIGGIADPRRVQLTERLLAELAPRTDLRRRLSQVDVSDPRNAVVLLAGEPAKLYLGDSKFLERLQLYEETQAGIREHVRAIDYFELRFDRVFVGSTKGN
jgi:cell division septal protein FtsQ